MIPPGWNVTEPISLAASLCKVVDSLRAAPEDAKAFKAQIEKFSQSLGALQRVIDESLALGPDKEHTHLRATLADCQLCVQRCQKFQESFQKLCNEGRTKLTDAGQLARWVWSDKQIGRLRHDIDSQMSSIGLSLLIQSLWVYLFLAASYVCSEDLCDFARSRRTHTTLVQMNRADEGRGPRLLTAYPAMPIGPPGRCPWKVIMYCASNHTRLPSYWDYAMMWSKQDPRALS